MKSMTGFAKQQTEYNGHKYTIEIKTLNSKTLDLNTKIPASLHNRELEIRTMLNALERGKIDFIITDENTSTNIQLNHELVQSRYQEITALADQLHCTQHNILDTILSMNDVWNSGDLSETDNDSWNHLSQSITATIAEVDQFRLHEGTILKDDFDKHVDIIEQKLNQIPQYEEERITTARERIQRYFAEYAIKEIDQNRFEQELIYYLEKYDITEEKVRLAKHINYFRQTMNTNESNGKKLAFVTQEMGREINTIGSKANHVEIQKLVVEMKDELEKIKEQLGNIL